MQNVLAVISGDAVISALVWLVVVGLIFWLVTWALGQLPITDPFKKVINVILVLVAVLVCVNVLLGLTGHPIVRW